MKNEDAIESYIMEALFALMKEKPYTNITITDIAKKAGVSRITFYRRFKNKEEIIKRYFEKRAIHLQEKIIFRPRTKDDYYEIMFNAFSIFKQEIDIVKLLVSAHVEYLYLDMLNEGLGKDLSIQQYGKGKYSSSFFAGALYNVSIEWLKNDCEDSVRSVADTFFKLTFPN